MASKESGGLACPHCGGNSPTVIRWRSEYFPAIHPETGQLDCRPKSTEIYYRCRSCLGDFTVARSD